MAGDHRAGILGTALRRRWRIVAAAAALGLLLGTALALGSTAGHRSTATIFLNPLVGNPYSPETAPGRQDRLTAFETEAALVRTEVVGSAAAEATGGAIAPDAYRDVDVTVPSNSQMLRIAYTAPDPQVAQRGAQAFAEAYLQERENKAEQTAEREAARLQRQVDATAKSLNEASEALKATDEGDASRLLLQQQVTVYANEIASLQFQISEARTGSVVAGDVITPAETASSAGLHPALKLGAGLLAGLVVGLGVALWRERNDDRLHSPVDVTDLGVGPVLTVVPTRSGASLDEPAGEPLRVLRTAVLAEVPADGAAGCVVALGAVEPSLDAACVGLAAGLAGSVERTGRRVVLVVADPDAARGAGWAHEGKGLSDVLMSARARRSIPAPTEALVEHRPGLLVLAPGTAAAEARDLYQGEVLRAELDRLRSICDLVVVAAPAVSTSVGQALAMASDATVLVAGLQRTRHDDLLDAEGGLDMRHVRVLGVALLEPAPARTAGRARPEAMSTTTGVPAPSAGSGSAVRPRGPGSATAASTTTGGAVPARGQASDVDHAAAVGEAGTVQAAGGARRA